MCGTSLRLTISFDHDIIDGAPAARFTQQLKELIESGYGLDDSTVASEQAATEAAVASHLRAGCFQTSAALPARRSWRIEYVDGPLHDERAGKILRLCQLGSAWDGQILPTGSMTIDQFVKDTIALIELLRARFGQQKVLLLGHSWGSTLAMKVAAARPDLLYAVIGMGQLVDGKRGEDLSYRYVLACAHAEHNRKAIRILEQLGAPPYRKDGLFVQRWWLFRFGGFVHALGLWEQVSILLNAPEYSLGDCISFVRERDMKFSFRLLGTKSWA